MSQKGRLLERWGWGAITKADILLKYKKKKKMDFQTGGGGGEVGAIRDGVNRYGD